jgi:hypothetical protein
MLKFSSETEALQHLADLTGKRVKIAQEELNLLTTDESKVQNAFDEVEGEGWFDESMNDQHDLSLGPVKKRVENKNVGPQGANVYGKGGIHRYWVRRDGRIDFSKYHADEEAINKAKNVGFHIF